MPSNDDDSASLGDLARVVLASVEEDMRSLEEKLWEATYVEAGARLRAFEDRRLAAYLETGEVPPICAEASEAARDFELAHDHWLACCRKANQLRLHGEARQNG